MISCSIYYNIPSMYHSGHFDVTTILHLCLKGIKWLPQRILPWLQENGQEDHLQISSFPFYGFLCLSSLLGQLPLLFREYTFSYFPLRCAFLHFKMWWQFCSKLSTYQAQWESTLEMEDHVRACSLEPKGTCRDCTTVCDECDKCMSIPLSDIRCIKYF